MATDRAPRVALDVASKSVHSYSRGRLEDVRHSCEITVPELPWPLRFHFVLGHEDDGSVGYRCAGLEIAVPVPTEEVADKLSGGPERYELSMDRFQMISRHFLRYRRMAELRLNPSPENVAKSQEVRGVMHRRKGGPWTHEERAILAADYLTLAREGACDVSYTLMEMYDVKYWSSIWRQLQICEQDGLIPPGILKHHPA